MSLALRVDGDRWRAHLADVAAGLPGLVPVVKGNGYGFGRALAAAEAARLGCHLLAVGTYAEAAEALETWPGDVLTLSAWRPGNAVDHPRLIHTIGRVDDLAAVGRGSRVLLEGRTSMNRHGLTPHQLTDALGELGGLAVEGLTIHLPLPGHGDNAAEADRWARRLTEAALSALTLFVSHLNAEELTDLRAAHPDLTVRPRVGTALWLGDLAALAVTASVLDVHPVTRGQRIGYRQRPLARGGHLVVIGAGTSHGVGLDAPKANTTFADRGRSLARGTLEAAGWARSPFVIDGRQRWYAEPPHMHHSLVLLPDGATPPAVGDEVTARVRFTTTAFDTVTLG